jgi:hypothetical protein
MYCDRKNEFMDDTPNSPYAAPSSIAADVAEDASPLRRIVRIALVLWWVTLLIAIVFAVLDMEWLPPELKRYQGALAEKESVSQSAAVALAALLSLIVALIGSVGVYFSKLWAEWVYAIANGAGYLISPFGGPYVEHGIASFGDFNTIAVGLVLGALVCNRKWRPHEGHPG